MISRRRCFTLACGLLLAALPSRLSESELTPVGAYTDPQYFTALPFGTHSHWLQPWRSYLETVPASTFINGLGMNLNLTGQDPDLVMRMLATHGIKQVRIEIGWGTVDYNDETRLDGAAVYQAELAAAKKYGVRPLMLLNANQGGPCPTQSVVHTVAAASAVGATTLQVDSVAGLRPGYSGLSNLTEYWAAEALITAINGTTLTLSKPLPVAVPTGTPLPFTTLKYRPFSVPGSADYQATMAGWNRYVTTIATFTAATLGTAGAADKGFDMEIWNELSFGSNFLDINAYYANRPFTYESTSIWSNLVRDTAAVMVANPALFSGVQAGDGFANTTPWQAAALEPARITAIDKHPYVNRKTFPRDEEHGAALNALGQVDSYVPSYSAFFPEYYGTGIQTETMVRDMGPITSLIDGAAHGRNARSQNGVVLPTTTWITEVNMVLDQDNPGISAEAALALKAKTTARYAAFYLNKGVTRLYFYGATGGDTNVGMVRDSFLAYARQPGAPYPADDSAATSPALAVLQRMAAQMSDQLDPTLTATRPLQVLAVSDSHHHSQFAGDGSAAHPPLYDHDVLALLPYQVNAHRFVIPYYVMTRNVAQALAPELFTVQLQGVQGSGATITAYDPLRDTTVPVTVTAATADTVTLQLTASDSPSLLVIQEH